LMVNADVGACDLKLCTQGTYKLWAPLRSWCDAGQQ
jgi:hypothetical protein